VRALEQKHGRQSGRGLPQWRLGLSPVEY